MTSHSLSNSLEQDSNEKYVLLIDEVVKTLPVIPSFVKIILSLIVPAEGLMDMPFSLLEYRIRISDLASALNPV